VAFISTIQHKTILSIVFSGHSYPLHLLLDHPSWKSTSERVERQDSDDGLQQDQWRLL